VITSTWHVSKGVATATHHWQADANDDKLSNIDIDSLDTKTHTVHASPQLQQKKDTNTTTKTSMVVTATVQSVKQCTDYKIVLLVYKSHFLTSTQYLANNCPPISTSDLKDRQSPTPALFQDPDHNSATEAS